MNTDELRRLHVAVPARKWVMSVDLRGVTPDEAAAIALFVEACAPARIIAMLDVIDAASAIADTGMHAGVLRTALAKLDTTP